METQYISLNMTPTGVNPCFHISQYDVGRMLGFTVYSGGATVDLDTYTCTIEATRSDGTAITSAVTTTDNIGTFEVTPTMSNKADKYRCQLVVVDENSKRIASLPFDMEVTKAAMDENSESIEEDASLYQQYTEAVQGAIAEANSDIQAEENARIAAVNAEATTRANADTTLQNNIDAEATARANAITAEAEARQTADNTLQGNINSEASTRASADSNLQSQINQIIAPSGEAPSAAEVQNARIGADGITYDSLGTSIRTQISNLKSSGKRYKDNIHTVFNGIGTIELGQFQNGGIDANGVVFYMPTRIVTDKFLIDAPLKIAIKSGYKYVVHFYDANGTYKSYHGWYNDSDNERIFAQVGMYIRVVVANTNDANILPEESNAITISSCFDEYEEAVVDWEFGNISLLSGGWLYSDSTSRIRSNQYSSIFINEGDIVANIDKALINLYIGIFDGNSYNKVPDNNWAQNYIVADRTGNCVLLAKYGTESTIANITDISKSIKVFRKKQEPAKIKFDISDYMRSKFKEHMTFNGSDGYVVNSNRNAITVPIKFDFPVIVSVDNGYKYSFQEFNKPYVDSSSFVFNTGFATPPLTIPKNTYFGMTVANNENTETSFVETSKLHFTLILEGESSNRIINEVFRDKAYWKQMFFDGINTAIQGGCTDGENIYYARPDLSKIYKYNIADNTQISASYNINLNHANDMTFNPITNKIYVVTMLDTGLAAIVNPSTLSVEDTFAIKDSNNVPMSIYGIAYIRNRNQYIVGTYGDFNLHILDSNFNYLYKIEITEPYSYISVQGIETDGEYIYCARYISSGKSVIVIYNFNGEKIKTVDLPTSHEIENISTDWNGNFFACVISSGGIYYTALKKETTCEQIECISLITSRVNS